MTKYKTLITEAINTNKLANLLLSKGYIPSRPAFDGGIDLIAYHPDNGETLVIQIKGRMVIDMKYHSRNIIIAFPHKVGWYLVPHDEILILAERERKTSSWTEDHHYSWPRLSKEWKKRLNKYYHETDVSAPPIDENRIEESNLRRRPARPSPR